MARSEQYNINTVKGVLYRTAQEVVDGCVYLGK